MRKSATITICLTAVMSGFPTRASVNVTDRPDTQSVHIYMNVFGDTLNTFNGTLSLRPRKGERIKVPLSLTAAEIDTILKQALRFDFFTLPDTIPFECGASQVSGWGPDELRIKWGEQDHKVVWYYPLHPIPDDRRRGFLPLRLANFIRELAQSKVNPDFRAPYSGTDKRIGYLTKPGHTMSHGVPPPRRFGDPRPEYELFDVYEEEQWVGQIVVIYQPDLEPPPNDTDRLLILIGEVVGTEWMYVREWHYIEEEP